MDPLEELTATTAGYLQAQEARHAAYTKTVNAIVNALRAGEKPAEVARRSPFSPAYVRRIARHHNIEGDTRYQRTVPSPKTQEPTP